LERKQIPSSDALFPNSGFAFHSQQWFSVEKDNFLRSAQYSAFSYLFICLVLALFLLIALMPVVVNTS
jgi:hypothetical protein